MKPIESDLHYAFCNIIQDGKLQENYFVKIMEYTHPDSAVPRARVRYECEDFFVPREKLVRPIKLRSDMRVQWDGFNITILSYFYKHPYDNYCSEKTPFVIEKINANGFDLDNLEELAEFIVKPLEQVESKMLYQMLSYVDELPF
jgi:hypothetical protein